MKAALLLALALAVLQTPQEPPAPPPAPKPPVSIPPRTDALALCVQACSRTYYFCLSQNDEETCSPSWAICRANCARTNPAP